MLTPPQQLLRGMQGDPARLATGIDRQLQSGVLPPWNIEFLSVTPDFSVDSDDELVLSYSVGKKRPHITNIMAKDCDTRITGLNITLADTRTPMDDTHDVLSLAYSIDKSTIATSNVWNSTSSKLEFCQVVQLTIPAGPAPMMVITED